jgi:hypothetical protein
VDPEGGVDLLDPLVDRAGEGKASVEARGAERIVGGVHVHKTMSITRQNVLSSDRVE